LFFAIWTGGAALSRYILSPAELATSVANIIQQPGTISNILATIRRLVVAVSAAYLVSLGAAWLMATFPRADRTLSLYVAVGLTSPGLAVAFVMLIVFGLSEMAIYAGVAIVVAPFM